MEAVTEAPSAPPSGAPRDPGKPRILYVDLAYTAAMLKERRLDQFVASRECGGYFDHVWAVHPLADLPTRRELKYDGFRLETVEATERQTIIEGSSAYYASLKDFPAANVLASQARFLAYLVGLVKREKISVVLVTDPYFAGLLALGLKVLTGIPVVVWVVAHYDDLYAASGALAMPRLFRRRWIEKLVERVVFRAADLVAGVNQNNLDFALKNGAASSKGTIFSNGRLVHAVHLVEPASREPDEWLPPRPGVRHFICVGRLHEVKHSDDAIRAFAVAAAEFPDCALIMAGDGPMRAELEKLAAELGVGDRVQFFGNISQLRLASVLAGCYAVLSPLTGGALFEASLAGRPLIVYDRDWQNDFVGKNGLGIVVPFRDWQKMGEAAIRLLRDPAEAARFGAAARSTGMDWCDRQKLIAHEQAQFDRVLHRPRVASAGAGAPPRHDAP